MATIEEQDHFPRLDDEQGLQQLFIHLSDQLRQQFEKQERLLHQILSQQGNWATANVNDSMAGDQDRFNVEERSASHQRSASSDVPTQPSPSEQSVRTSYTDDETRRRKFAQSVRPTRTSLQSLSEKASRSEEDLPICSRFRLACQRLLQRKEFQIGLVCVIVLNFATVGAEVQAEASLPLNEVPGVFSILNFVYTGCFVAEVLLKWLGFGIVDYFTGQDRLWNIFDFLVILFGIFDFLTSIWLSMQGSLEAGIDLRALRFVRVARMGRVVRIMKIIRFIHSLRALILSLYHAMRSLIWTIVLVLIILYTVSVLLTQATTDFCREEQNSLTGNPGAVPECHSVVIKSYWASLPLCMTTLFKAVASGISWHEASRALEEIGMLSAVLFYLYVVFMSFMVLNVFTGVFCNSAIEGAKHDKDMSLMTQLKMQEEQARALGCIFEELDRERLESVTFNEFEARFQDKNVKALFASMGIENSDAWTVFNLLDHDGRGMLTSKDFVLGCLQLKGEAKALHIAQMRRETKAIRYVLQDLSKQVANLHKDNKIQHNKCQSHSSLPHLLPLGNRSAQHGTDAGLHCSSAEESTKIVPF